jgi:signal transduction histidine kinase
MIKTRKGFLDNITVAKKSFLLLLISTIGLFSLGAIVYFGLYNIKNEVNHIYADAVENISSAHELQYICNTDLQEHLQNYINHKTNNSHTILNLQEDSLKINKAFNKLKNTSSPDIDQLAPSIQALNKIFLDANKVLDEQDREGFAKNIVPKFNKEIFACNKIVNSIMNHKLLSISSAKKKIEEHYYGTIISTTLFIIIIFIFCAILAYSIYQNIKRLIFGLSNIVAKKTKDYQELALQLEYKVNKEVIKNREKDQIMYQHARLAAMGEMIGNIAHQWRQPLNALTVLIQSFGIKNMSGGLTQEFIDKQVEEGLRLANQMSSTIEDFKNFFSPHKEREYFGVVQALKETLDLVEFFCKDEHIDIKLIAKEEIRVYGYSNEFSQVILNLLNNARDNFKQKNIQKDRKIIIKVERKNRPEPYVMISFVDNGGGIDEHIIDRIFEPYFTTKHKSTGTGIGLYMSKQIIEKQMNGLVTMKNITSKMGTNNVYQCAQFIIAIPLK